MNINNGFVFFKFHAFANEIDKKTESILPGNNPLLFFENWSIASTLQKYRHFKFEVKISVIIEKINFLRFFRTKHSK